LLWLLEQLMLVLFFFPFILGIVITHVSLPGTIFWAWPHELPLTEVWPHELLLAEARPHELPLAEAWPHELPLTEETLLFSFN